MILREYIVCTSQKINNKKEKKHLFLLWVHRKMAKAPCHSLYAQWPNFILHYLSFEQDHRQQKLTESSSCSPASFLMWRKISGYIHIEGEKNRWGTVRRHLEFFFHIRVNRFIESVFWPLNKYSGGLKLKGFDICSRGYQSHFSWYRDLCIYYLNEVQKSLSIRFFVFFTAPFYALLSQTIFHFTRIFTIECSSSSGLHIL